MLKKFSFRGFVHDPCFKVILESILELFQNLSQQSSYVASDFRVAMIPLERGRGCIRKLKQIKQELAPNNIMSPGKLCFP